jgi:hypothetical protein
MDTAFRGLSISRLQHEYCFLTDRYGGSVALGKTRHDGPVVGFPHDYRLACRASCEHSLSCSLAGLHDIPGNAARGRFVSPVVTRAAKSARTGSYESSAVCRLNFLPELFFTAAFMATLTLPDVLTTGARDRLRGKFLFQRLPTNWTISAPHIHTCLSLT